MSQQAHKPDYPGQMVKVAWPCQDNPPAEHVPPGGVYGDGASYAEFNEKGELIRMRRATDEEVQWWLSLQTVNVLIEEIRFAVQVWKNSR